jgi:hypothetical protein
MARGQPELRHHVGHFLLGREPEGRASGALRWQVQDALNTKASAETTLNAAKAAPSSSMSRQA